MIVFVLKGEQESALIENNARESMRNWKSETESRDRRLTTAAENQENERRSDVDWKNLVGEFVSEFCQLL
jgi:hypothetical protein